LNEHYTPKPVKAGNHDTLPSIHHKRLRTVRDNASQLSGAARQIELAIDEVLARGGILNAQAQIAYMVGSIMRMQKDLGVIEQLQQYGIRHKSTAAR
jgi:hypothetical protein